MPFRSKAQMRLFYAKQKRGEISKKKLEQWKEETPSIAKLPERVKKTHGHSKQAQGSVFSDQGIFLRQAASAAFCGNFSKVAFAGNLPEQAAAEEAAKDFTQVVKGSQLEKEIGQAKGGYNLNQRTGETRVYPQSMRHRWRSSRG